MLDDWLHAMVVPVGVKLDVPDALKDRTIYIENNCRDIWAWSEKVYRVIEIRNHKFG